MERDTERVTYGKGHRKSITQNMSKSAECVGSTSECDGPTSF